MRYHRVRSRVGCTVRPSASPLQGFVGARMAWVRPIRRSCHSIRFTGGQSGHFQPRGWGSGPPFRNTELLSQKVTEWPVAAHEVGQRQGGATCWAVWLCPVEFSAPNDPDHRVRLACGSSGRAGVTSGSRRLSLHLPRLRKDNNPGVGRSAADTGHRGIAVDAQGHDLLRPRRWPP